MLELPRMTAGRYTPRKSNLTRLDNLLLLADEVFAYFIAAFGPAPAAVRTPVGVIKILSTHFWGSWMWRRSATSVGVVWSLIRGGAEARWV